MIFFAGVDNGSVQVLVFRASCMRCSCFAGLITRPDDQLDFWNFRWINFLVGSLVAVVCDVPIYFISLSCLGCCRTHPAKLTGFFCSRS